MSTAYSPVGTNLPAPQPPPRWRRPTLVMSGAACARCRWSYAVYRAARGRLLPVPDHVAQKIREGPWRPRDARARHHGPGSSLARHHANEEVGIVRRDDCREDQDPRIFAQPVAELSFRSGRERRRWPSASSKGFQNLPLFAPKRRKNIMVSTGRSVQPELPTACAGPVVRAPFLRPAAHPARRGKWRAE